MMPERPPWAEALYRWIEDDWIDSGHYPKDHSSALDCDAVTDKMREVLCDVFGHEIVDDQCNIPEHRFCVWCHRREPAIAGDDGG